MVMSEIYSIFEYIMRILQTFADTREYYDLTSNFWLYIPVMKVKNINNCKAVFYIL